ncbi:MAG: GNAT family N-acetyltransferase, partial [candidate division KSB1 bacterium]|nr:GNAT family N-acetyltransferase [candidate division KSB1 bacterium]
MNKLAPNLHYQIFTTASFLEQAEKEWNALLRTCQENIPFLRSEWLSAWWLCFGKNARPFILILCDNHKWIAAGAFYQGRFQYAPSPMSALQLFANGHSYRSGLIVRTGHERKVKSLLAQVFQQELQQVDLIFLRDVPEGSILSGTDLRRAIGCKTGSIAPMLSPFIKIEGSWEDYWAKLRGHFRANLRRRLRKLQQLGEIRFTLAADEQEIAFFLQQGLNLEASGWKGKMGSAILANRETHKFYHTIADWAAAHGWLRLFGLFLNNRM